jgi:hypothetical protein
MKKITEMTHEEIIKLDQDDINRLVDLACAEQGIPLLPGLFPEPKKPHYDDAPNAYELAGITCRTRDTAEAIQGCLRSHQHDILDHEHYVRHKNNIWEIEECVFVPKSEEKKREAAMYEYQTAHNIWQEDKALYNQILEQREKLELPIVEIWSLATRKQSLVEWIQRKAQKYLDLAEGNIDVAVNFLTQAYSDELVEISDIFSAQAYLRELVTKQEWKDNNERLKKAE